LTTLRMILNSTAGYVLDTYAKLTKEAEFAITSAMKNLSISLVLFFVGASILSYFVLDLYVLHLAKGADFGGHIMAAQDKKYLSHFLYHWTINALTLFSGSKKALQISSFAVLFLAILLKLWISWQWLDSKRTTAILFLTTLFFVSPIINWWQFPKIYLGQISPNTWHNPTIMMATPFYLAVLFFLFKKERPVWAGVFLLLATITKPNFALCFIPALLLYALLQQSSLKSAAIIILPTLLCLIWQFVFTYTGDTNNSRLIWAPFKVWSHHSPNLWGSLLVSFAFPFFFTLLFFKELKDSKSFLFGWLMMVIALAQFVLLAEEGVRMYHGNFGWGTQSSLYFLFLLCINELNQIKLSKKPIFIVRYVICVTFLLCHFASGVFFHIRTLRGFGYYA